MIHAAGYATPVLAVIVWGCCTEGTFGAEGPTRTIAASYTGDLMRSVRGGLETGGTYLEQGELTFEFDQTQGGALEGLWAYANALYNNSATFSDRYAGDAQTASNIDAPRVLRIYEAWVDWRPGGALDSLRAGLHDLNAKFDTSDARSLFVNSSFGVGHDLGQTGRNGPSIFPAPGLGLRLAFQVSESSELLLAVLDGDPGDPQSQSFHLGGSDGVLAAIELQGSTSTLNKLALGAWHYSQPVKRLDVELRSAAQERMGTSGGAYALGEIGLLQHWHDRLDVDALARVGFASGAVRDFATNLQAGIVVRQPFATGVGESLGLGVTQSRTSAALRRAQYAAGDRTASHETAIELTYRRALASWFAIQPDAQWIINPGANPTLRDALVVAVRIGIGANRSD